jgi:hypothetical protein
MHRSLVAVLVASLVVCSARSARADVPDLDIRGPIRVGSGYSTMYGARVLSISFEDELQIKRISDTVRLHVVFGMDGVRGPAYVNAANETKHKGFLGVDIGPGLLWRIGRTGPAFVVNGTIGPLWESSSDDFAPHGIGVAGRAEIFPFYQDLVEAVVCKRGWVATYVFSGINAWALARQDWLGSAAGATYAVGLGIELGRNLLLPILGAVMDASCSASGH